MTISQNAERPVRRRGVIQLHEEILGRLLDLPEGQRIIAFRDDPVRMSIDVCVEGDGLPECPPGAEAPRIDNEPYVGRFSRWAMRGADLEERVEALAAELNEPHNRATAYVGGSVAKRLRGILADQ